MVSRHRCRCSPTKVLRTLVAALAAFFQFGQDFWQRLYLIESALVSGGLFVIHRQISGEDGTVTRFTFNIDSSVVLFDDTVADTQAQPDTFDPFFRGARDPDPR